MSSTVEQIKEKLDIVEVIGSYIKVEKAGQNYKAKCPFHNEKTASFFISPSRQGFYCFGCQAKGDVFTFVERFEGLDFMGALRHLADRAGVRLEEWKGESKDQKEKLYQIMETAAKFFEKNLSGNKDALSYLEKRGMDKNSISKWRVGFAPAEWRSVSEFLSEKGFKKQEMLQCGIIKMVAPGKIYDTFRGRIMFPIFDSASRVIAFSGRIFIDDGKSPKYLNSPETELFKKSEILYGWNFAKDQIRALDYAVLVEGQMDLCIAHQGGTKNAVASSGTALTIFHLEKIAKITKRIIIAYDSDEAGRSASRRAGEMALGLGMEVKIAILPEGEDPASIILKSVEKWRETLKSAVGLIDFAVQEALSKSGGSGIKLAKEISKSVVPYLATVENDIVKSEYASQVSKKTKISEQALWNEISKFKFERKNETTEIFKRPTIYSEEEILSGIILWQESLPVPSLDILEIKEKIRFVTGLSTEEIVEDKDKEALIFEVEAKFANLDVDKSAKEIIQRIEKSYLEKRLKIIAGMLDSPENHDRESLKKEALEISKKLSTQKNQNG